MGLFAKKVKVYEAKGKKAEWKAVKAALKEAGLSGVSAGSWQDEVGACGCGGKIDCRDYGEGGKIDRDIYMIRVKEADQAQAEKIVLQVVPDYKPYEPSPNQFKL